MCFSSPPKPSPPPPQEKKVEQAVLDARDRERLRQKQTAGYLSTMLTGGSGVTAPATLGTKTLLGQ